MSYDSKNEKVLAKQLAVQELCVEFADVGLYTVDTLVVTVDLHEAHTSVLVLHVDNSAGTVAPVAAANRVTTGTEIAITLAAAFAANDSLIIKYIVTE